MMRLEFPEGFLWGTSTAAAQIETASDHNWKGFVAKDGHRFEETAQHEKRRQEDVQYISRLGQIYRCGVDWARLQSQPFAPFDAQVVAEYQDFFRQLNQQGVQILFVLHHFAHPQWFETEKGWLNEKNIPKFMDYVRQCVRHFGPFVSNWNTFNEPNVFAMNAYILGNFPPQRKRFSLGNRALRIMGMAHQIAYIWIKEQYPNHPIGISFNTATFVGKGLLGKIAAGFVRWWFIRRAARPFRQVDYWGLSYYAYVPFQPFPVTEIDQPGKLAQLGIPHDKMWGYFPEGLGKILRQFYKRYQKPLLITESGICTDDAEARIQAIKDYLQVCHQALADGIPVQGYIHWSTFDNFEWNLGPTYRFGLVQVNLETGERTWTKAASYYEKVVQENAILP